MAKKDMTMWEKAKMPLLYGLTGASGLVHVAKGLGNLFGLQWAMDVGNLTFAGVSGGGLIALAAGSAATVVGIGYLVSYFVMKK